MSESLPPTRRAYREDAYATRFTATVVAAGREGEPRVVLDATLFYPTAGGQQHDTGTLAGYRVLDVINDKDEGIVTHVLEPGASLAEGQTVEGQVDWPRRFDFMQQHTGEHILGQAFYRLGFHVVAVAMGEERCTLDLNGEVPPETLREAESAANRAVWAGLPVTTRIIPAEAVPEAGLRRPPQVTGPVRVVEVEGWDRSACGGTHVRNSGEVGLVKVLGAARVKGGLTRVTFLCGERAVADYGTKHKALTAIGQLFSAGPDLALARVQGLLDGFASAQADLARADEENARLQLQAAGPGSVRVLCLPTERALQAAVKVAATLPGVVSILGAANGRAALAVACGPGAAVDARAVLDAGLKAVGGRGGGKPTLAQGSAPDPAALDAALESARQAAEGQPGRA
ncbi:MAG TPA: alanyl-tRNA editing protein [Deinococcales bacterium]|nr:alanyl-tRNA editing protein [Deinococcales bacterium]